MTPVTLVTKDATLDDLTLQDYADMVAELRQTMSFDKMIAALGSVYSKALWAKVADGATPNREQRNELRRYFGKPPLPPTVAECTAQASPDAAVWTVGEGVPDTVVMVASDEPLTLRVNGTVQVVTTVTERKERQQVEVFRPMLDVADREAMKSLNHKYSAREIWHMGIKAARALE